MTPGRYAAGWRYPAGAAKVAQGGGLPNGMHACVPACVRAPGVQVSSCPRGRAVGGWCIRRPAVAAVADAPIKEGFGTQLDNILKSLPLEGVCGSAAECVQRGAASLNLGATRCGQVCEDVVSGMPFLGPFRQPRFAASLFPRLVFVALALSVCINSVV